MDTAQLFFTPGVNTHFEVTQELACMNRLHTNWKKKKKANTTSVDSAKMCFMCVKIVCGAKRDLLEQIY